MIRPIKPVLITSLFLALLLTGCASKTEYNFYTHPPATNNLVAAPVATAYYPYQVQVYKYDHKPNKPFTPVGEVTVTKMNNFGFMRQQARIKTLLREEATVMGGDALIILPNTDDKICRAEVIKFQHPDSANTPPVQTTDTGADTQDQNQPQETLVEIKQQ